MNRYPLWKYIVILVALAIGFLYTLPNFFGEAPAVQVSSGKATVKVDLNVQKQVESLLAAASIRPDGVFFDNNGTSASVRVRFADTDTQLKAKDVLARGLNTDQADPTYIVALNLLPGSPQWLSGAPFFAKPMFLGLDLRGGVHFLLQVDMNGAVTKKLDSLAGDIRTQLRDKGIRHSGIDRNNNTISIKFSNPDEADRARTLLADSTRELAYTVDKSADGATLTGTFTAAAMKEVQDNAVKQNIVTLHNRVNELGVAEPVIQQQGPDRIVVQLPGVQDTAKAKDIIGRTATLEARLADPNAPLAPRPGDPVPLGDELFTQGRSAPVLLQKQVIFTGDRITSASAGFDQNHNSSVDITLDGQGGRMLRDVSRDNIGKRMGIVLFEKGKGEVLTVATIQSELGSRFQITGMGSTEAASDLALLLRAGSLAAPMEIIEERTIGPSLGADNIKKGFDSALYGFLAISVFMVLYYMLFGAFSVAALGVNVFLLIALLSMLQATLTLPGIAAIALALGMAIDANVLINERVREELRSGASAQMAIAAGFDRAWATILDSNVTTLIAGLALIAFGSGPVRGFAIVHCLGIGTSMFSAVFFNRGLVNLWYGRKKKLQSVAIGQVWKPGNTNTESPAK
ncbi:preprotein translocase subunit SecD [Ralstonia pickettii]|uniref:protein translocase subunit SecD n=2 Tax=Pseudomonadota TaxID=1224 RepID=UPI0001E6A864|nr:MULTISPECIES: protein translocase subunit SecD [Ralstonia]EFP65379.1 export membrane protein SecD [Ralstonia pickettii]EGY66473.1 protein-export membrane protein SecD [Ralstonia sp. 5_2_56FAA]KFL20930.1 export membrane protein SecD [Ralstonia pickettii]MBU6522889.1 protein translocase subunit SecD [Ralstonia sp. B265]NPT52036.1 protein translocase subunit SecD [Ralstonia sp. 3N]